MRPLTATLLVGTALLGVGCNSWLNRHGDTVAETTPVNEPPPTVQQMVDYLNLCAGRLNSVQSNGLYMDCKAGREAISLTANMVCEKQRNFRLRGTVAGQLACDIGSNNEEFWYWIKQDDPPGVKYCSYEAMAKGNVRLPFPFQPDMVIAALGMAQYDPDPSKYELKVLPKSLELSENAVSSQGQQVRKVTVFTRAKVDPTKGRPQPQVTDYVLRDLQGNDLCKATVEAVTYQRGAIVPQKIRLKWPAQKIELTLTLNSVNVNSVDAQLEQVAFSRRDLPYPAYDLARGLPDANSTNIRRVRGAMR